MEFAGSDVNHENVGPYRDEENKRILSASTFLASPHWMISRVMCSTVDVSSLQVGLRRDYSRARLGVLYTVHGMRSFLFEYFSTVVLAPHANRYRAAQVG
jgi:hypothetical protein